MITLDSKTVAVNDSRSNMYLEMDANIDVTSSMSFGYILNMILDEAPIKNLVFNCHGSSAFLEVGVGIRSHQTHLFARLSGRVEKIWLYACSPARGNDGNAFCSSIAKSAQCYVLASTVDQNETLEQVRNGLSRNTLDTFEGPLLSFGPTGHVTWSRTYPSGPGDWANPN